MKKILTSVLTVLFASLLAVGVATAQPASPGRSLAPQLPTSYQPEYGTVYESLLLAVVEGAVVGAVPGSEVKVTETINEGVYGVKAEIPAVPEELLEETFAICVYGLDGTQTPIADGLTPDEDGELKWEGTTIGGSYGGSVLVCIWTLWRNMIWVSGFAF